MPNILFFQEVYPEKYDVEAMMTKRIMDSLQQDSYSDDVVHSAAAWDGLPACEFDKIPTEFTGADAWPKGTNLWCWQCRRTFKTRPFALVSNVINAGLRVAAKIDTRANLCSGDCAGTLLDQWYPGGHLREERWRIEKMTLMLFRALTGRALSELPRAPPFTELEQFGGRLSVDAFINGLTATVV